MTKALPTTTSPWPHRWAVVLACATFPLLWVGGLVTTTDSGMAVPDWPNTYGQNMFLYPLQSWLFGPSGIRIEHGHRLLASSVGIITIGLLILLLHTEQRRWIKALGFAALGLVIFQGVLGGMRVLFDERTLAMLHGCTGPLFFALTVAIVVLTSRTWLSEVPQLVIQSGGNIHRLAVVTAVLAYLQIVLGAVLRHVPIEAQPSTFLLAVKFHVFLAAILAMHIAVLVGLVLRRTPRIWPLGSLAACLAALVFFQLALGATTWIVKFAVPSWAPRWISAQQVAVQEGSWLQTHIITAHVATGSLIFATAVALAVYAQRLRADSASTRHAVCRELEGAV